MNKEQVYYDPRTQVIFTVKRQMKRYVVIGGSWSPYYNDAQTSYIRYRVTNAYFKDCQPIDKSSHLLHNDGIGFRLQDGLQFNTVHSNPDFKYLKEESAKIIKEHDDNYPLSPDYDYDFVDA